MRKLLVVAALGLAVGCNGAAERRELVRGTLRTVLAADSRPPYVMADGEGKRLWKLTRQFYERRQHAPAWIDGTRPLPQVDQLITALGAAAEDGLDPQLYNLDLLVQRRQEAGKGFLTKKGFQVDEAGSLDVWLTYVYMKFASDLADGLSDLAHADPRWHIKPERFDPAGHLEQALQARSIDKSLLQLAPEDHEYRALRKVLGQYKALAAKGAWPVVPPALKLKPGQKSPHVATLARRLAASGDYGGAIPHASPAPAYSGDIEQAVKRFQLRHGLLDDGVIAPGVIAEMNVPVQKRIRQIELNLERWRWLPRRLGDRHILVNVPEHRLEVRDRGQVPVTMRVVVGKKETPTPIFNDEMTYVVFSPYWNVPSTIAQGETVPELLSDPRFLERTNMEVIDASGRPIDPQSIDFGDPTRYRFRQRPGAENSLGLVKFMFPNEHNVYLHDTPTDSLFLRASRSFSHGCVRLEQPLALAEYVLRDQPEWTRERIEQAMHGGEERTVKLHKSIPVYLVYWTARAAADGVVQFRKDVYGIDEVQTDRLTDQLTRLRKSAARAAAASPKPLLARAGVTETKP